MRGSIPVAWRHRNIRAARKPSIVVEEGGDHDASMRHFDGVAKRYETPIVVLNLVRQQEKRAYETKLSAQYLRAIGAINTQRRGSNPVPSDRASEFPLQCPSGSPEAPYIAYVSFDLLRYAKTSGSRALGALQQITDGVAAHTGVFCSSSERQRGVLRTNCIDCLDRTNVAQFTYGRSALKMQMQSVIKEASHNDSVFLQVWPALMRMYARHGDQLARQYGDRDRCTKFGCALKKRTTRM